VVDDNPAMALTLADILDARGFVVHSALSGVEALPILHDHTVDILLTAPLNVKQVYKMQFLEEIYK
jgi:CheY-like chemotaxis protein